jgi:hypothetical protein
MNVRVLPAISIALTTVFLAAPASAGDHGFGWDYKNHSGAACQAALGKEEVDFERGPNYIANVAVEGRSLRRVVCPIVRDNVNPSKAIDASVTVSAGVKDCTFFSMDNAANVVAQVSPSSSETLNGGKVKLYFALSEGQVAFDGTFSIRCTLGPLEAVFGFNAGELTDSTDYGA